VKLQSAGRTKEEAPGGEPGASGVERPGSAPLHDAVLDDVAAGKDPHLFDDLQVTQRWKVVALPPHDECVVFDARLDSGELLHGAPPDCQLVAKLGQRRSRRRLDTFGKLGH